MTTIPFRVIISTTKGKEEKAMTEWIKIDEQQAEASWMGYEDYLSTDGKYIKRVWYDGEEEIFKTA